MPVVYTRDDARRLILVEIYPPATRDDWLEGMRRQAAEGVWEYGTLFDARGIGNVSFAHDDVWATVDEVRSLAARHGVRGPIAIVSGDQLTGATARMYTTVSNGVALAARVFVERDHAEQWLTQMLGHDRSWAEKST